jgi:outer membrane protein assembly factor BamB
MCAVSEEPRGPAGVPGVRARVRHHLHPHRRTLVRIGIASVLAIALLAGIGGAIRSLGADGRTPIEPGNVDRLHLAWSSDVGLGPIDGLSVEGGDLYVSTREGLVAFGLPCQPDASTPDGECRPDWHGIVPDGPLSAPVVRGEQVYAGSAAGQVYAFPAACAGNGCPPEWVGVAGTGPVSEPGVNDDFVYVTSDRLYAFPSACGTQDRACPPTWSAAIPGAPANGPPAVGGGLVVVASSSPAGGVFAFPAVCSGRCEPVWTGDTNGPATAVAVSGQSAFVAARGQLMAFPLSCRDDCSPSWTSTFSPGGSFAPGAWSPPTVAGDLVYMGGDEGTLWVFPASCPRTTCSPARSYALSGSVLHRPTVDAGLAYSTSIDGTVYAVVDLCDPLAQVCDPPWSLSMGAHTAAAPAVGGGAIYAGDDDGQVHAYTLGPGA